MAMLILSECVSFGGVTNSSANTNQTGEVLTPLKAGKSGVISYGLFSTVKVSAVNSSASFGGDFIIILRNIGAKSIYMGDVTVQDFKLQDSAGKNIELYLWSVPRTIGYQDCTVIHLVAARSIDSAEPLTLSFKSKPNAHVPIDLSITGIERPKSASSIKTDPKR
jgi:hypothetical protein